MVGPRQRATFRPAIPPDSRSIKRVQHHTCERGVVDEDKYLKPINGQDIGHGCPPFSDG
jgi:hypothetical protein